MVVTLKTIEDLIFNCNDPRKLRLVSHILQSLSNMAFADARYLETKDWNYTQMCEHSESIFDTLMEQLDGTARTKAG